MTSTGPSRGRGRTWTRSCCASTETRPSPSARSRAARWTRPAASRRRTPTADARALLDGADWVDHDCDGVRDKGGVALKFAIATSDEPARLAAARQIADDLTAVGIRVDVRAVPFAELVDRVARQRDFDALLVGITVGTDPDPYPFFHSSQV